MASAEELKESHPTTTPPPIAAAPRPPPRPPAEVGSSQSRLARSAFLVLAALMSVSLFVEPFAAAAAPRLPWAVVVATLVLFAAFFCASVHLFRSFFLRRPLPAAVQWEGVGAITAVGVRVVACLVAAGGSAYGYAPARS